MPGVGTVGGNCMPWIDLHKNSQGMTITVDGVSKSTDTPPGVTDSAWPYIDPVTGWPSAALLAGASTVAYTLGAFYLAPITTDAMQLVFPSPRVGVTFKVDWEGTGTPANSGGTFTGWTVNGKTATFNWSASMDTSNNRINWSSVDPADPIRNVRVYRADYESLLSAGELFDPVWLAEAKKLGLVYRFMDSWLPTNSIFAHGKFSQYTDRNYRSRAMAPIRANAGTNVIGNLNREQAASIDVCLEFAKKANKHPWINIPPGFGTYKYAVVENITFDESPTVHAPGHTFVDGEKVVIWFLNSHQKSINNVDIASDGTVSWPSHGLSANHVIHFIDGVTFPSGQFCFTPYYVSATDLAADSFKYSATPGGAVLTGAGVDIDIVCSLGWRELEVANSVAGATFQVTGHGADATIYSPTSYVGGDSSSTCYVAQSYDGILARLTTEVTLLAQYVKDNLPKRLVPYFELSNEPWNSGGTAFGVAWHFWNAQKMSAFGQGLVNRAATVHVGNPQRFFAYISAHIMKTIRDVFGDRPWRGVVGVQTADLGDVDRYVAGINAYISDYSLGLTAGALFGAPDYPGYIAVSGYFDGACGTSQITSTWADIITTSKARYQASLEVSEYAYFNRMMAQSERYSNIPGLSYTGRQLIADNINSYWPGIKTKALAAGFAGCIQYEGATHTSAGSPWNQQTPLHEGGRFWLQYFDSKEHAEVLRYMHEQSLAQDILPAVFVIDGSRTAQFGPWAVQRWSGGGCTEVDNNERWKLVKAIG